MSDDCYRFRRDLYHFQAGELPEADRRGLAEHAGDCPACARRLEVEEAFLQGLRSRLGRAGAPPALRDRVRAALDREERQGGWAGWLRVEWLVPAAAALLLAFVLIPAAPGGALVLPVDRVVTVVDLPCERAGRTLEQQRGCDDPRHFNALKVGPDRYWTISLDHELGRRLLSDRGLRGHRLRVVGDLFTASGTLHLVAVTDRSRAEATSGGRLAAEPVSAVRTAADR
jgi:anti-sigma factor (TIGR02949 family)